MADLTLTLIRRLRPVAGWPPVLLAVAIVLCLQYMAATAQVAIPTTALAFAGLGGLLIGQLLGRWGAPIDTGTSGGRSLTRLASKPQPRWQRIAYWSCVAAVLVAGSTLLLLQSGKALPPAPLFWRDAGTAGRLIVPPQPTPTALPTTPQATPLPQPAPTLPSTTRWDTIAFLASSLPRFGRELQAAPNNGQTGAQLIAGLTSVFVAWASFLVLGLALRRNARLVRWGLPLLAALVIVKLLGGGSGYAMLVGIGLLLLLVLLDEFAHREQSWLARNMDYASDLRFDTLAWGGVMLLVVLCFAAFLPFSFDNRFSRWVWSWVEPPSGIVALERSIEQNDRSSASESRATIAGSTLPSIALGRSLEEGDPDTVGLRVHVNQPLPAGPWPAYWRSRILMIYTGDSWYTNAFVTPDTPFDIPANVESDLIVQDVEDPRQNRTLIYGFPDIIGINQPSQAERLPDGSLAASNLDEQRGRYRIFSRPPGTTLSPVSRPEEQPDMTPYLQLPPDLPARVGDLAHTITRDTTNANGAALALERYLRELPYSYEVAPLPNRGDAVDQFLFDMRQGYCSYYASALAVLARSLGIPARVSVGYATGDYDAATQTYTVYERDAHAWPELYLDGRWVAFEPTPVRPLPARSATRPSLEPVPVQPVPAPQRSLGERIMDYWPGIVVILVLMIAIALPWLPRLRPDYSPLAIQRQLEQRGARVGVAWPAGATLHEYAALLRPRLGSATTSLDTVVLLIEESRYSGHGLSADQQGRLILAWALVKENMRS